MPKDIKPEFLTGPRNFDVTAETSEIIINEMIADEGPVPMNLENVSTDDARTTYMSYDDVCAFAWNGCKARKGAGKQAPNGAGTWYRRKGADEWTSGKSDDGGENGGRAPRAANPIGTPTRTKGAREKARAKAIVKPHIATTAESKGTSE